MKTKVNNNINVDDWYDLSKDRIYCKDICSLCQSCKFAEEYEEDTTSFKELKDKLGIFFKCTVLTMKSWLTPKREYCQYFENKNF